MTVLNCTSPNIKTQRREKGEQLKQSERHKGRGQRWHKEGRTGEGEALFRQSDNVPSPEHICGCPLTPSRHSLWRQSEQLWPACRFPIISLAEGSGLPIHQQVWTCKLWWQSIRGYTNHTTVIPGKKYFTFTHNTLIISTRSFLATPSPPKNTWSQGILITLLVESSTERREVWLASYWEAKYQPKHLQQSPPLGWHACVWVRKLNDANWFYPPKKPPKELTLSSKLQYTIYFLKTISKHDL